MYEKKIQSLARKIAKLKEEKGNSPRYPQEVWEQIFELHPHFSLGSLALQLGISPSNLHKRISRLTVPPTTLDKKSKSPSSTLVPISQFETKTPSSDTETPVLEMELPSGVKIRIYS